MINFSLNLLSDNLDQLEKRIKELEKAEAFVGYDDSQGTHEESGLNYPDLMKILSIGFSPRNLPARPIFTIAKDAYNIKSSPIEKDLNKYFSNIKNNKAPISTDKIGENWASDFGEDVLRMFGSTSHLDDNAQSVQDRKGFNAPLVKEGDLRDNLGYSTDGSPVKKLKNI